MRILNSDLQQFHKQYLRQHLEQHLEQHPKQHLKHFHLKFRFGFWLTLLVTDMPHCLGLICLYSPPTKIQIVLLSPVQTYKT